jgi:hypothetical protein
MLTLLDVYPFRMFSILQEPLSLPFVKKGAATKLN